MSTWMQEFLKMYQRDERRPKHADGTPKTFAEMTCEEAAAWANGYGVNADGTWSLEPDLGIMYFDSAEDVCDHVAYNKLQAGIARP